MALHLSSRTLCNAARLHNVSIITKNHPLKTAFPTCGNTTKDVRVCRRCHSTLLQTVDSTLQLSTSNPLYQGTHNFLELVHTSTDLPWWLSIVVSTFCIRSLILLPVVVAAQRNQAKLVNLSGKLKEEAESVSAAVKHAKWLHKLNNQQYQEAHIASMKKLKKDFYEKHKVHPMKSAAIIATQFPVFVLVSLTLRNMSGYFGNPPQPGFASEGGAWFSNLTLTDPMMILPVTLGAVTLINMKVAKKTNPAASSLNAQSIRIEKMVNVTMVTLAISLVPLAATQPSSMSLYWACSSFLALFQNLAFSVPSVRRALGIPKSPVEPDITRLFKR